MGKLTRAMRLKENSVLRRGRQREEVRALILRAAGEEFEAHGYEGFSLRHVAERIGYTPTTIYLYFNNKDELLLETARGGFAAFDASIEKAALQPDPCERLRALGQAYFQFGLENPALYRLMFMQRADFLLPRLVGSGSPPEELAALALDPGAAHHRVVAQELLVRTVEDGTRNGIFRAGDPTVQADALWAAIHGLTSLAIGPLMSPEHAHHVTDALLDTLIQGLK